MEVKDVPNIHTKGKRHGGFFNMFRISPGVNSHSVSKNTEKPFFIDFNILLPCFLCNCRVKPIVDKCFPLSETAKAFQYFGEGHFKGKVVITVEHNNKT
jgi:hypothetical protein